MKNKNIFLLFAVFALFIAACGTSTNPDGENETAEEQTDKTALATGKQCFHLKDKTNDASLEITLDEAGNVSGTVDGTVEDDENGYYTSWTSNFSGTLEGAKLNVKVHTEIEGSEMVENKVWEVTEQGLVVDGKTYKAAACTEKKDVEEQTTDVKGVYIKNGEYDSWIFAIYQKEGMNYAHFQHIEGVLPAASKTDILKVPLVKDFTFDAKEQAFKGAANIQGFFDFTEGRREVLFTSDEGGDPLILSKDDEYTKLLDRIKM